MKQFKLIGLVAVAAVLNFFPAAAHAESISMDAENWTVRGDVKFLDYRGEKAARLLNGSIGLEDMAFHTGIIEYDIAFPEIRGFTGVYFRNDLKGNSEDFYIRPHLAGMPDANQYQPFLNGNSAWQLMFGPQYSAPVDYDYEGWNHVKFVVAADSMDVYINSEEPVLHIDDLRGVDQAGAVILRSALVESYVANVSVEVRSDVRTTGMGVPNAAFPDGLVTSFGLLSDVQAETAFEATWLDFSSFDGDWQVLEVEENGIANIGRYKSRDADQNTALVRMRIRSDSARVVPINYGFSDRVRVYINGTLMAANNAGYQSRDYRYLGTVGLFETVYAHLNEGENEVIFAVSEDFGGWGIMAQIQDQTGLTVIP